MRLTWVCARGVEHPVQSQSPHAVADVPGGRGEPTGTDVLPFCCAVRGVDVQCSRRIGVAQIHEKRHSLAKDKWRAADRCHSYSGAWRRRCPQVCRRDIKHAARRSASDPRVHARARGHHLRLFETSCASTDRKRACSLSLCAGA